MVPVVGEEADLIVEPGGVVVGSAGGRQLAAQGVVAFGEILAAQHVEVGVGQEAGQVVLGPLRETGGPDQGGDRLEVGGSVTEGGEFPVGEGDADLLVSLGPDDEAQIVEPGGGEQDHLVRCGQRLGIGQSGGGGHDVGDGVSRPVVGEVRRQFGLEPGRDPVGGGMEVGFHGRAHPTPKIRGHDGLDTDARRLSSSARSPATSASLARSVAMTPRSI